MGPTSKSTSEDILTPLGFLRALWACMNLRPDGTLVAGIKCSSWSIVNRPLFRMDVLGMAGYNYLPVPPISKPMAYPTVKDF